jgi:chromosome segregation ATPase
MSNEPESLMLRLLREMRAEIGAVRAETASMRGEMSSMREVTATKDDLRSEINSLRADVVSDIAILRKEVGEQITGLRRAVVEYHSSVIGHGILISELEARMRRVEQHLNLPAIDTH